jgi:HK97 gp10 family phage protein
MIQINVSLKDKAIKKLDNAPEVLKQEINKAIQQSALLIHNTSKRKIQSARPTGRIYKRRSITHRASAPGQPPASDTGRLANSIRVNFKPFVAEVGSAVKYSAFLENGTSKMLPRPWLEPSYLENENAITAVIDNALKRVFK